MLKLGTVVLNRFPHLVLTITDQETNAALKSLPVDVLEIRVDQFKKFNLDDIKNNIIHRKETRIPIILTIRNMKFEGGKENISDDLKMKIFQSVISWIDAVDIEFNSPLLSSVISLARRHKKVAIVSWHDFKRTPESSDLEKKLKDARRKGADIVKIAARANSFEDVNRLMQFTMKYKNHHLITMSLGKWGSISRLVFPLAGSLLTYTYLNRPFAPGQVPVKILHEHLCLYYALNKTSQR